MSEWYWTHSREASRWAVLMLTIAERIGLKQRPAANGYSRGALMVQSPAPSHNFVARSVQGAEGFCTQGAQTGLAGLSR